MKYHLKRAVGFGIAMLLSTTLAACAAPQTSPVPVLTPPGIGVAITQDACPSLEVRSGMQVVWTNQDSREHVVQHEKLANQDSVFDSGVLQPGDSFAFTFTEPGRYTYWCAPNGAMKGMVTVEP